MVANNKDLEFLTLSYFQGGSKTWHRQEDNKGLNEFLRQRCRTKQSRLGVQHPMLKRRTKKRKKRWKGGQLVSFWREIPSVCLAWFIKIVELECVNIIETNW